MPWLGASVMGSDSRGEILSFCSEYEKFYTYWTQHMMELLLICNYYI